ncbi:MAG: redox-sensing transcriptional repressor Rex [Desulfovibrionales bacterium GWA2_65_9]|jgi:redox-sensing transcriptional repressor|nr:redox-sensing transcriptional repressor Rex [Humidesulfovibrio sp.]MDP3427790.1 redox-sensing transcriptional repressor Rex [Humidesulfovibrio sp.]OGR35262.1 MAG: redox-sensing transcriptional repressor Rex [Desulfovibrionales bacterium GWA2_65_9]PKN06926.1 MAG: redox-sensing transcriptional repressor Rex [Deltaproteobacteria bacterium HGW-Deltaproteobacteria-8]
MKSEHIPKATIARLATYIQVLSEFKREGTDVVSSERLAEACSVNSSQIRKDLAYFGEFGVRGVGYYVQDLITSIKRSLGIDRAWNCGLVGVGNLGRALLRHREFSRKGFIIRGAFDCDPYKIGEIVEGMEIVCSRQLPAKVKELSLEIGIITTPPERAQRAANYLVGAGIKGIINFAPSRISVPSHIHLEYVDFFHHFYAAAFHIRFAEHQE